MVGLSLSNFVRFWGFSSNGLGLSSHSFKLTFQRLLNLENRMTPKASEIWIRKEGNPWNCSQQLDLRLCLARGRPRVKVGVWIQHQLPCCVLKPERDGLTRNWLTQRIDFRSLVCLVYATTIFYRLLSFLVRLFSWTRRDFFWWCRSGRLGSKYPVSQLGILTGSLFDILRLTGLPSFSILCIEKI